MRFLIVFPISNTRLHVMYDTLENLRIDSQIGRYIDQLEKMQLNQHALIGHMYFIVRVQ